MRLRIVGDRATPVLAMVFAVLATCAWRLNRAGRGLVLGLGLLSAFYILPLLPGRRRLKQVPYCKAILVAVGWAVATMLLPFVHAHATPVAFLFVLHRPLPDSRRFYATVADALVGWPGIIAMITLI